MKLLLDQGLPRSAAALLRDAGHDAIHTGEIGMATSTDEQILAVAVEQSRVVVTLDADFHTLLALSDANEPSVVRIRIEGLRAEACCDLIQRVLTACESDITGGAAVSVLPHEVRVRRLPLR